MSLKNISLFSFVLFVFLSCTTISVDNPVSIQPEKTLYDMFISDAETGDVEAMVQIGISYEEGSGVTKDLNNAYEWYKKAASKGSSSAYYRIGMFYEYGYAVEKDWNSALEWYYSSAASGYSPAIGKMIDYYEDLPEEQILWIEKGLSADDPYANYRYGLLVEQDDKALAIEYFKKTADTDIPEIRGLLSILSLSGQYQFYKELESIEYLSLAAESGDSRSQTFLGWLNEFGIIEKQNYAKSFKLYKAASDDGEILATYNLSRFYGEAIFVDKDPSLSNEYFKKIPREYNSPVFEDLLIFCRKRSLAEQLIVLYRFKAASDDYDAYYNLGKLYDDAEALPWFSMAADAGHIPSMYELGKIFYNNNISDYNPVKAAAWLMVYENKTDKAPEEISSTEILGNLSDSEKMEVSRLFTVLYYNEVDSGNSEEDVEFLK